MNSKRITKKVIFPMGGTGGVGKTTAVCMIADYLLDKGIPFTPIDCDEENASFKRFYPNSKLLRLHRERDMDELLDTIVEATTPVVLCDFKAGTGDTTADWFSSLDYDELADMGISFVAIGVMTSKPESLRTVAKWISVLRRNVEYLIVRNQKEGGKHSPMAIDSTEEGSKLKSALNPSFVTIPQTRDYHMAALEKEGWTIREVLENREKDFGELSAYSARNNLRSFRANVFSDLEVVSDVIIPDEVAAS